MLALTQLADNNCSAEREAGNEYTDWRFQGYRGFRSGDWRYGVGKEGAIVVVSRDQASIAAPWLAEIAEHWSRVDYCVTVLDDTGTLAPDIHYWEMWPPPNIPEHQRPDLRRVQQWHGGATITIGSRSSAYFTRVYNKHAESPQEYPLGSWRWEVEMKRQASEAQQNIYRKLRQPGRHVLAVIENELNRVSLTYPWRPGRQVDRERAIRPRPDADRTLGWLAYQVRPPAQFAAQARGRDAVLAALDI